MKLRDKYHFRSHSGCRRNPLWYSSSGRFVSKKESSMANLTAKLSLLLCVLTGAAYADTYRWVDDNGIVNFAEQMPRGVPAERVTKIAGTGARRTARATNNRPPPALPAPVNRTPAGMPGSGPELNEEQQEMLRELQSAEAERQEQVARIRQDNCDRSRRVLNNLTAKDRIRVRDDDGTERSLPEDERQQRIADAQRGIVEFCDT